jgi:hypothetical protein
MIVITGLLAHLILTSPQEVITRIETVVACGIGSSTSVLVITRTRGPPLV